MICSEIMDSGVGRKKLPSPSLKRDSAFTGQMLLCPDELQIRRA